MNNDSISVGTIFITGISASGKSTLGKRLKEDLVKSGMNNVKLLDGEDVREQLAKRRKRYGYSTKERNKLALELARMASEYNKQGIICILCSICHRKEIRKQMRALIGVVMEVYLDCPVNICALRDYKEQYVKAFHGLYNNFVGVTEPYQISNHVELILNTDKNTVNECADILFKRVGSFLSIEKNKAYKFIDYTREEEISKRDICDR